MRIKEVEDRTKVMQEDLLKYVKDLKEIFSVREEQVIATMATVKEREKRSRG